MAGIRLTSSFQVQSSFQCTALEGSSQDCLNTQIARSTIITTIIVRIAVYHLSKAYYMPGSVIEGSLILTKNSLGFYHPHL